MRVGYFERRLNLTPEQVEYLTVASKGATTSALADWKQSTQQTVDRMVEQMGQMRGNFAFSAQNVSVDGLDNNEIWAEAVRTVNADNKSEDRANHIQHVRAMTVTAFLDQELWLTPAQREDVMKFTEQVMPKSLAKGSYDDYVRELVLLAYPLHKVSEAKVNEVLTESQLAVWKQLKDFLRLNRGNNYIEIPMKNQGGSFSVPLLD